MSKQATVLFVDDEENILNSLRRGLIDEEFNCIFVSSGPQALEVLEKEHVDVIISDMRMPGMDGLTLLKEVKEKYPKTVRCVLSGYAQLQQIIATLNQADIFRFVLKPWKLEEEFKGVIQQALDYHRLQDERDEFEETLKLQNQAYQNILRKFNAMTDAKRGSEVQTLISSQIFEMILIEINKENNPVLIRRKLETAFAILSSASEITFKETSEISVIEFFNELKEKITLSGLKVFSFEVKANETDVLKTNYTLLHSLFVKVLGLLSGVSKNVKISYHMECINGERTATMLLFIENFSGISRETLKEFEQHLEASIAVLNPLLNHIMKILKGSFQCARSNINTVAKFKFLV